MAFRSPASHALADGKERIVRRLLAALEARDVATIGALFDGPLEMSSHDVVASEAHVVDLATYRGVRGGQSFVWNAVRLYHVDTDRISEIWLMIGDQYAFDAWLAD